MPGASYPKEDPARRTRHKPKFDWVDLPAEGRTDPAPELPEIRIWHDQTKTWWTELWSKPQALMCDQTGSTMWALAGLYDDFFSGRATVAQVSAEMRQHEDRHGLNPKAMLQLRWRIVPDEVKEEREAKARPRLRAIDPEAVNEE